MRSHLPHKFLVIHEHVICIVWSVVYLKKWFDNRDGTEKLSASDEIP